MLQYGYLVIFTGLIVVIAAPITSVRHFQLFHSLVPKYSLLFSSFYHLHVISLSRPLFIPLAMCLFVLEDSQSLFWPIFILHFVSSVS